MTDLSHRVVTVWDASGSYTHMAEALVGDVARVLYYVPYETGFPIPTPFLPGYGVDGIERVGVGQDIEDFWDAIEISDFVVFTDVGNYGLVEYLRRQRMPVFGSGRGGRLEQNRLYLKSTAKKLGLDIADYIPIRGVDSLRDFLMGSENNQPANECWVKLSFWRGLKETFQHDPSDLAGTRSHLDELAYEAGPYAQEIDFLVEKPIDEEPCVEVGFDTYSANGMFPDAIMWGYEADKDNCYVGTTGALPGPLVTLARKLSPALDDINYRGPLSTESRKCEDKNYLIDLTARFPEPPSSLQRFMINNWAEIMWECANGRIVEADFVAPVGVQIVWKSGYGREHPLAVSVGREDRVTIHGHCVIDGQDYAVSPAELEEQGAAIGLGSTVAEAMEDAVNAVESIKARELKWDAGALEKINEAIAKGNELGLVWR